VTTAATRSTTQQIGIYHGRNNHTVTTSRDNHPNQPYTLHCTCGQTSRHTNAYDLDISATRHAYPTRWQQWTTRLRAALTGPQTPARPQTQP